MLPNSILIIGPPGSGKSTLTDDISRVFGYNHLHIDEKAINPDGSISRYEYLVNVVKGFVGKYPKRVVDYVEYGENINLLSWLITQSEMILETNFTKEDSVRGMNIKNSKFRKGILPSGLSWTPQLLSENSMSIVGDVIEKYPQLRIDAMKKIRQIDVNYKALNSFGDIDRFRAELFNKR